jgi:hypothetical protein
MPKRLCILVHFYQWLFIYDDFFDDGIWNRSPEDARHAADIIINVLRDPETSEKTPFAAAEILRNIMLSVKKAATKECQRRIIEHSTSSWIVNYFRHD